MPEKRLDRIERKLDLLADGMVALAVKVDEKSELLEQRLGQRIDAGDQRLERKMDAGFKRLSKWLRAIESTQIAINRELSDSVANHEQRIVILERVNPSGPKTP